MPVQDFHLYLEVIEAAWVERFVYSCKLRNQTMTGNTGNKCSMKTFILIKDSHLMPLTVLFRSCSSQYYKII